MYKVSLSLGRMKFVISFDMNRNTVADFVCFIFATSNQKINLTLEEEKTKKISIPPPKVAMLVVAPMVRVQELHPPFFFEC